MTPFACDVRPKLPLVPDLAVKEGVGGKRDAKARLAVLTFSRDPNDSDFCISHVTLICSRCHAGQVLVQDPGKGGEDMELGGSGVLNLCTLDIWSKIILCRGRRWVGGGEAVLCTVGCLKARQMRTVAPDLQNWQQSREGAVLGSSTHMQWLCTRRLPLFGYFFIVKEADNRTYLLGDLCKA